MLARTREMEGPFGMKTIEETIDIFMGEIGRASLFNNVELESRILNY